MTKHGRKKLRRGTSRMPTELTERERRYVDAFVGEAAGNATRAAQIAGYSGKNPQAWSVRGSELLNRARVRDAINERRKELAALQREADERLRKEKLEELVRKRAEQMLGPSISIAELQRWWAGVVMGEIEGFDGPQRIAAARDLARSLGAFVDEKEIPPPQQISDGDHPRLHVSFVYVDNGRGPRAPIDALPLATENTKR